MSDELQLLVEKILGGKNLTYIQSLLNPPVASVLYHQKATGDYK